MKLQVSKLLEFKVDSGYRCCDDGDLKTSCYSAIFALARVVREEFVKGEMHIQEGGAQIIRKLQNNRF